MESIEGGVEADAERSKVPFQLLVLRGLLAFCVVLAIAWGFVYEGVPTGSQCWIVEPGDFGPTVGSKGQRQWKVGLGGYQEPLFFETDSNFEALYVLNLLAVCASALGTLFAATLRWTASRKTHLRYCSYASSLFAYFLLAVLVNFTSMICFVEYRCHHHNVMESDEAYGVLWVKCLYLTSTVGGGIFTNIMLELVLFCKCQMVDSHANAKLVRALGFFIRIQLLVFAAFAICLACVNYRQVQVGSVDTWGGQESANISTTIAESCAVLAGMVHIGTSSALVYVFLQPLFEVAKVACAAEAERERRTIRRVALFSSVALFSTLLSYGNFRAHVANEYHVLLLDSLINDTCLMCLSFLWAREDYARAQREGDGTSRLASASADIIGREGVYLGRLRV